MPRRGGIQFRQCLFQHRQGGRVGQVGLGEQEPVGHRRLAPGFRVGFQLIGTQQGVNRGDHAIHAAARGKPAIIEQRVEDGSWVGDAGGLDDDALVKGQFPRSPRHPQILQGRCERPLDLAADATTGKQGQGSAGFLQQLVIQPDLAELVHHHGGKGLMPQ